MKNPPPNSHYTDFFKMPIYTHIKEKFLEPMIDAKSNDESQKLDILINQFERFSFDIKEDKNAAFFDEVKKVCKIIRNSEDINTHDVYDLADRINMIHMLSD